MYKILVILIFLIVIVKYFVQRFSLLLYFTNKIKFDRPTAKTREHIWKSKLPELEDKIYEKLSIYDLSGGQIENVTRKYLINKILNQKEFDFDEILEYIKEEMSFKNDDNSLKVGFLK